MPPDLAIAARRIFYRMQSRAKSAIDQGRLSAAEANAKLLPWAAIARRCGADLLELRHFDGFSCDIAPRSEWAPLLAETRDRALDAYRREPTPERGELVGDLVLLASRLGFDMSGPPIPPYRPALPLPAESVTA